MPTTIIAEGKKLARRTGIVKRALNPAWKFLLPIFAVWLLLYGSYELSRPSLPDGPGTMHAEIAREMVIRHDWVTPFANGFPVRSVSKALDRSIAASFQLFGVADWSARLPIALWVLGTAVTVFFFARKLFVWNAAGLYAALFLLTIPITFLATRDLTEGSVLMLLTVLFALVLWQLLVARRLTGWNAAGVTATACLLVLLAASWPGVLLPLFLVALCWAVRWIAEPHRQAQWFLAGWALCAYLFANAFEYHQHAALTGLGAMPPLALLLGGWLADREISSDRRTVRIAFAIFAIGLLGAALAVFLALHHPFSYGLQEKSLAVPAPTTRVPLLVGAAALLAGVTGHLLFRLRNQVRVANCFLAGTLGGLIVAIQVALVMASPWVSSQILADAIRPELDTTDIVVIDGKYPEASSMAFYIERPVLLALPATKTPALGIPPPGTADLDQIWSGSARVFLWTNMDHPRELPGPGFVIARSGGKEILSNRSNAAGANF